MYYNSPGNEIRTRQAQVRAAQNAPRYQFPVAQQQPAGPSEWEATRELLLQFRRWAKLYRVPLSYLPPTGHSHYKGWYLLYEPRDPDRGPGCIAAAYRWHGFNGGIEFLNVTYKQVREALVDFVGRYPSYPWPY